MRNFASSLRRPTDSDNVELLFEEGIEKLLSALKRKHPVYYAMIDRMEREHAEKIEKLNRLTVQRKWIDEKMENDQELMTAYDHIAARVDCGEITQDEADELYGVAAEVAQVKWTEEYDKNVDSR